jgi:hypothetical protein
MFSIITFSSFISLLLLFKKNLAGFLPTFKKGVFGSSLTATNNRAPNVAHGVLPFKLSFE